MMLRLTAAASVLLGVFLGAAQAAQPDPGTRIDAIVQHWMNDFHIENAEVAIASHGKLLSSFGHGWNATDKQPLGSLSKLVTGLCVASLMDQEKLHVDDTLGEVLGNSIMMPKDPRFATITIGQLLMHRAGLVKNAFNDEHDHNIEEAFASATRAPLDNNPGTAVAYSDSGYLMLGYVIQHVANARYEDACAHVFTDAGLPKNAGVIDPTLAARAPNGGWDIDAADYAELLSVLDPKTGKLGKISAARLQGLSDEKAVAQGPCPRFQPEASYGFGFCRQVTPAGVRFYHDGLLHFHPPFYKKTGGSFFYVNEAGVAAVVIFSGENKGDAYHALETEIINAMPVQ